MNALTLRMERNTQHNGPRVAGLTRCWIWLGAQRGRYGAIKVRGRMQSTHRVSWALANGEIPFGLCVLHCCDNGLCIRPSHLFLGTNADNTADAKAKGRLATGDRSGARQHPERLARGDRHGSHTHPERRARGVRHWTQIHPSLIKRGSANGMAVLNDIKVRRVRALRREGWTLSKIAIDVSISKGTINDILQGRTWRHVR